MTRRTGAPIPGDRCADAPEDAADAPGDAVDAPGDAADAPEDAADAPEDAADAPRDAADVPGDAADALGDAVDAPGDAVDAPGDAVAPAIIAVPRSRSMVRGESVLSKNSCSPMCGANLIPLPPLGLCGPRWGGGDFL